MTQRPPDEGSDTRKQGTGAFPIHRSDAEWRQLLSPECYHVLREHGTEPAFRNAYHDHKEAGIYECAGCGNALFSSRHKYDSGSGWPSFTQPLNDGAIGTKADHSFLMVRVEVYCSQCGGHLGHVFSDGPKPTGMRYCMNSAALQFRPAADNKEHKDSN